ncbi:MAG: low molecular weight protein arginine phosphatase [Gaiellales bacterium]|nr:MAG: low molecular weight protein arginine phosphatase [Gaiellales bacterium]
MSSRNILFVCTGNICRSPLAEYFFRDYVEKRGQGGRFQIGSAGTYALDGNRATYEAIEAGRSRGLDLTPHRAREVNGGLMSSADLVLAMTRSHHDWLSTRYPGLENKIYLTMLFPRRYDGRGPGRIDVPDPIGESVEHYLQVLAMLEPALPKICQGILEEDHS